MLARAAVRRTSIVILDEPLAALDPNARGVVARALRSIGENRTTIVIHHGSTDDIAPDMEICLQHGEVVGVLWPLPNGRSGLGRWCVSTFPKSVISRCS